MTLYKLSYHDNATAFHAEYDACLGLFKTKRGAAMAKRKFLSNTFNRRNFRTLVVTKTEIEDAD